MRTLRLDWLTWVTVGWLGFIAIMMFRGEIPQLILFVGVAALAGLVSIAGIRVVRSRRNSNHNGGEPRSLLGMIRAMRRETVRNDARAIWEDFRQPGVVVSVGDHSFGATRDSVAKPLLVERALQEPNRENQSVHSLGIVQAVHLLSKRLEPDWLRLRSSSALAEVLDWPDRSDPLIIIGSEANNKVPRDIMDFLRSEYDFPFRFRWDDADRTVNLIDSENVELRPSSPAEIGGWDYALVVRVHDPDHDLLMFSGCHMHGTWGAVAALTDTSWLRRNLRVDREDLNNFALLLHVKVAEDVRPQHVQLREVILLRRGDSGGCSIRRPVAEIDLTTTNDPVQSATPGSTAASAAYQ